MYPIVGNQVYSQLRSVIKIAHKKLQASLIGQINCVSRKKRMRQSCDRVE